MATFVYFFGDGKADGHAGMKPILGGKGAGLHEMTNLGIPVPPGFTISAEVCRFREESDGGERYPEALEAEVDAALARLERLRGKRLGDPRDPLLVSVRSGAAASMPGMMDTVLNLGLNDRSVLGLAERAGGNRRFAFDAYRRFISMFASIVSGVRRELFEDALTEKKRARGARSDADLAGEDLAALVEDFKAIFAREAGEPFPQEPRSQLWRAIGAVFESWNNDRALRYRREKRLTGLLGTAVNVQSMVFGNLGDRSATGVGFTRDPATGEDRFYGEFLVNAQGEDVVAGIRTPLPIARMEEALPDAYRRLLAVKDRLERHFRDVQDMEFTVEEGELFLLQTRTGQRSGLAALRIATDMVDEGLIDAETAVLRVEPSHLDQLLFAVFDPAAKQRAVAGEKRLVAKGLAAGPGAACGAIAFTARDAEARAREGVRVILVRNETSPEDIGGMVAAQGILTSTGGLTSHAAVVGRGMGKCCVVGCGAIRIDHERREMSVKGRTFAEGAAISIDGTTGEVIEGELPTSPSEIVRVLVKGTLAAKAAPVYRRFERLMAWADAARRLKVRANADTPEDARAAVAFGAQGIGLTRTEHMFFGPDRLPVVRAMIVARDEEARRKALARLEPMQREDFIAIFRAMGSRPVTIRLLDPPLHEFLPHEPEQVEALARDLGITRAELEKKVASLHEFNPMLGHRGCRLGITYPEIYEMQVRAIARAACAVGREGIEIRPEIMIPLVAVDRELKLLRKRTSDEVDRVFDDEGLCVPTLIGTMIEIPRACMTADAIAREADFFSFGTNDLTQCTYGFSRDDAGTFLPSYEDLQLIERDPFATLDQEGVGGLVRTAVEKGRAANPKLKIGICGEHGGDAPSVRFFHAVGLDYVSCSPYRLPVARLAAAQAALEERGKKVQAAS